MADENEIIKNIKKEYDNLIKQASIENNPDKLIKLLEDTLKDISNFDKEIAKLKIVGTPQSKIFNYTSFGNAAIIITNKITRWSESSNYLSQAGKIITEIHNYIKTSTNGAHPIINQLALVYDSIKRQYKSREEGINKPAIQSAQPANTNEESIINNITAYAQYLINELSKSQNYESLIKLLDKALSALKGFDNEINKLRVVGLPRSKFENHLQIGSASETIARTIIMITQSEENNESIKHLNELGNKIKEIGEHIKKESNGQHPILNKLRDINENVSQEINNKKKTEPRPNQLKELVKSLLEGLTIIQETIKTGDNQTASMQLEEVISQLSLTIESVKGTPQYNELMKELNNYGVNQRIQDLGRRLSVDTTVQTQGTIQEKSGFAKLFSKAVKINAPGYLQKKALKAGLTGVIGGVKAYKKANTLAGKLLGFNNCVSCGKQFEPDKMIPLCPICNSKLIPDKNLFLCEKCSMDPETKKMTKERLTLFNKKQVNRICKKCFKEKEEESKKIIEESKESYCTNCGNKTTNPEGLCDKCKKMNSSKMFCPYCGEEIDSDSKVCPFCGSRMN